MRLSFYTASLIALLIATPAAYAACSQEVSTPLQFVSLWDHEKAKVEGLNRINELCKDENYSQICLKKHLTPTASILPLYTAPNGNKPFGAFSVKFAPGEGAKFRTSVLPMAVQPVLPRTCSPPTGATGHHTFTKP